MRKEWNRSETKRAVAFITCLLTGIWLTNCDNFETEVASTDETALETIQREVLITPKTSGIFNLQSFVTASGSKRVAITSQPQFGKIESLGNDVMRYTPHAGVLNGRDKLMISVYSPANVIEKQDSIIVIITSDSTDMPCNLAVQVQNDFAYKSGATPVDIDVLANDTVCGVPRSAMVVTVPDNLVIAGTPMPKSYYGSVEVLPNKKIRYTPGAAFVGSDKFVYQVEKPANIPQSGDAATTGYGFVYITSMDSTCKARLSLKDDLFTFKLDTIAATDSLYLNTALNDVICTQAVNSFLFTFTEFPAGRLYYSYNYGFTYLIPANATAGSSDRFRYQVCVDDVCKEAEVKIEFK
jgi:hypothetical protein